jgi:uncharacterized membrane protein
MSAAVYQMALVAHVVGITIMAGTTFIDFITFRTFLKAYRTERANALLLESYLYRLQRFLGIGMLVILASGVLMMVRLHEVWGAQLWFRIKMGILVLIIINGLGLRRVLGSRLKKLLSREISGGSASEEFSGIKKRFSVVQVIQMLLFVIIYTLSVFKFN